MGGIETFNRAFLKASSELSEEENFTFKSISLHDSSPDDRYISPDLIDCHNKKQLSFVLNSIKASFSSDIIIIGHINLAPIGYVLKKIKKNAKIILIAHGIEVWYKMSAIKQAFLKSVDGILSVSNFTKNKLMDVHGVNPDIISVFPDTIDPFFCFPEQFRKPKELLGRHNINESTKVFLTVCRMSSEEQYKGYDKVIEALPLVISKVPDLRYIVVGSGDESELKRVKDLAANIGVSQYIIFTGFVSNKELAQYYTLADLFILPSKGEGFGIVFLEALVCGKPVIVGNKDASKEVILNGELGLSIDPDNINDIATALLQTVKGGLDNGLSDSQFLQRRALEVFGYEQYKHRLSSYLNTLDLN